MSEPALRPRLNRHATGKNGETRIRLSRILLFLVAMAFLPTAAEAQSVSAADPESVAGAMHKLGYRAEPGKDKAGDPMIRSAAGGYRFIVFFYGCTEGADCSSIQFHAAFNTNKKIADSAIAGWNALARYSKAFLDKEGDPVIVMDIITGKEGVPTATFEQAIRIWENQLPAFVDKVRPK